MNSPSRLSNNMSMNSLNTTSHNAERISALAEKLNQIQVTLLIIYIFRWVFKMKSYQD